MYKTKNHSKYSVKVHLVFVVKYRKELINNELRLFIKQKFQKIADRSDFDIELMETDKNHIYLLVDYEPKISILQIVRKLKQEPTYSLWRTYRGELRKHFWRENTFWSDGYFACSIGEGASYDTIQEYIKAQG